MHRSIEASVPSDITEAIVKALMLNKHVVGLSVMPHASLKPAGDIILVHVLNRGADEVMRTISDSTKGVHFSIVTAEVASINDPKHQKAIDHDIDEAIWEEMETGLRHNGRLTSNYLMLMAIGGMIAAMGFVSDMHNLVIFFIASSVIAPGLEPLAKIPLGIVLKRKDVLWTGIKASVVGYLLIMLSAGITFWLVRAFSDVLPHDFLDNKATHGFMELTLTDFLVSLVAAAASIIMYLSYRRNVIAGPLIALILIPVSAAIGMSLSLGEWTYATDLFKRLSVDFALVIILGIILVYVKQKFVHKRQPIR